MDNYTIYENPLTSAKWLKAADLLCPAERDNVSVGPIAAAMAIVTSMPQM